MMVGLWNRQGVHFAPSSPIGCATARVVTGDGMRAGPIEAAAGARASRMLWREVVQMGAVQSPLSADHTRRILVWYGNGPLDVAVCTTSCSDRGWRGWAQLRNAYFLLADMQEVFAL